MKFHYVVSVLFFFVTNSFACPYIILNDTDKPIMIVDPNNHQAVYITPGDKKRIDPSISGWQHYLYYERLDIYEPSPANPHLFYRHYQLKEKKCSETATELSLHTIIGYINNPSDRYEIYTFQPHKHAEHNH